MNMEIRVMQPHERLYAYSQSQQLTGQTGSIGYLRGDMGRSGREFHSSWEDYRKDRKTPEFQKEFDDVVNALRSDGQYGGILKDRNAMAAYCSKHPESTFEGNFSREYAFRVDTEHHAYLIRCIPEFGDNNFYIFPYQRRCLDHHMKEAEKGIRFITPDYREKFRIPDGDMVRITTAWDEQLNRVCRYIDPTHLEVGRNLYHICEFAERMERNGATVIPLRSSLPELCYGTLLDTGKIVIYKRGETGYYKADIPYTSKEEARSIVDEQNALGGVSKAQEAAMAAGSMFGFDVPAADPANYDENGQPIKPKHRDRGDAR